LLAIGRLGARNRRRSIIRLLLLAAPQDSVKSLWRYIRLAVGFVDFDVGCTVVVGLHSCGEFLSCTHGLLGVGLGSSDRLGLLNLLVGLHVGRFVSFRAILNLIWIVFVGGLSLAAILDLLLVKTRLNLGELLHFPLGFGIHGRHS